MSLKSPMSGTLTSIVLMARASTRSTGPACPDRARTSRSPRPPSPTGIVPSSASAFSAATVDVLRIDLEEVPQLLARVRAAEAVGAEHDVAARHERADLLGEQAHVVGRRDHRTLRTGEAHPRRASAAALPVGCSMFQRVTALPSRASSVNDGQLQMSLARPSRRFSSSAAAITCAQDHARAHELHARRLAASPFARRRRSRCTSPSGCRLAAPSGIAGCG